MYHSSGEEQCQPDTPTTAPAAQNVRLPLYYALYDRQATSHGERAKNSLMLVVPTEICKITCVGDVFVFSEYMPT